MSRQYEAATVFDSGSMFEMPVGCSNFVQLNESGHCNLSLGVHNAQAGAVRLVHNEMEQSSDPPSWTSPGPAEGLREPEHA